MFFYYLNGYVKELYFLKGARFQRPCLNVLQAAGQPAISDLAECQPVTLEIRWRCSGLRFGRLGPPTSGSGERASRQGWQSSGTSRGRLGTNVRLRCVYLAGSESRAEERWFFLPADWLRGLRLGLLGISFLVIRKRFRARSYPCL